MTVLILLVLVAASLGQEVERDPCEPNPCGENTRCQAVFIRGNPVISCDCLPNYKYPVGGDSSDGCVEVSDVVFSFYVLVPHLLGQDSTKGCLTIEIIEATLCMSKIS